MKTQNANCANSRRLVDRAVVDSKRIAGWLVKFPRCQPVRLEAAGRGPLNLFCNLDLRRQEIKKKIKIRIKSHSRERHLQSHPGVGPRNVNHPLNNSSQTQKLEGADNENNC